MDRSAFNWVAVLAPFLMCSFVPSLIYGLLLGQWGTNLVWGAVYGFGWFVAQSWLGPEGWRTAAAIGVFVWPPIVLIMSGLISDAVWRSNRARVRESFLRVLALSCLPTVPAKAALEIYAGASPPADFNVLMASW